MVTMAWHNVVAILSFVAWLFWAGNGERDDFGIGALSKLIVALLFYLFLGVVYSGGN